MNILNYCLRSRIASSTFPTIKRSYKVLCKGSLIHNNQIQLPANHQSCVQLVSYRSFMKKMGLKPIYDVYNKKAAKDNISPTEYELIYNGTGEMYVRSLSGILIVAVTIIPTSLIFGYIYTLLNEGNTNFKTYLEVLVLPHTSMELAILFPILVFMKIMSYSFISKYVLRVYRHNMKEQHVGVFINPILPWKNIRCNFKTAIKLPDGKLHIVPWYKEYHQLSGYKSIILRERFRRPVDYDRMLGLVEPTDKE
ncbi:Hypothetical protein CINCED_3A012193 [Cinara cedri]|uniref:Uncharacterized protein n=1 Tax=Cinara cedri TaxID=506608 RepID=A0A5E4NK41_9HEMI|nr:Hypothetical protein CINCED_3A012193 [Cinara cedri]